MIWLNGTEIVRRIYAGGLSRDAERCNTLLARGGKRILVKVRNRTGMWGFHLRFTDRSDRPAAGLRFSP